METDKFSPTWVKRIKSSIRPFITYLITALYFYIVICYKKYDVKIVNIVYSLNYVILLYWYSEKILRNVGITDILTKGNDEDLTDNNDPKWINNLKSTIRPLLTYAYTFLFLYVLWKHTSYKFAIIKDVSSILMLIILFWFGERWLKNVGASEAIKRYFNTTTEKSADKFEEAIDIDKTK